MGDVETKKQSAVSSVSTLRLSQYINSIRGFLIKEGFFEHHLYSLVPYRITNTDTYKIDDSLYLRYNPEPDIWQAGTSYDQFFWIGSMFRNEPKLDRLHKKEFTVADIYKTHGSVEWVQNCFIALLKECELRLEPRNTLSSLPFVTTRFHKFNKKTLKINQPCWLLIQDYPDSESFYDQAKKAKITRKFEIFYLDSNLLVEVAACGMVGKNTSPTQHITPIQNVITKDILKQKLMGFGLGIERVMLLFENKCAPEVN